jgi:hypothetical protein
VLGGGLLDATARLDRCSVAGAACNSFIGLLAGSTGSLWVDGSGSRALLTTLEIGGTYVVAEDPGYGGQAGGTGRGSLSVTAGGQLQSMTAALGRVRDGSGSIGTEHAEGSATISGAGSVWRIGADTVTPAAAGLTV